jgi:G3E family GTPase
VSQTVSKPELEIQIPKREMPVTVITGFLGSGKTTLLNHILSSCQNLKVAVLVNEFGDINIDSQLLVSVDEQIMQLSNGCICCTLQNGLVDAVYQVLTSKAQIDHLVIETTGIADPYPIIFKFLTTELWSLTRLDAVLTVLDASSFTPDYYGSKAALSQIVRGDVIVLNKTDLVEQAQLDRLENEIRKVNAEARILRSQYGQVPLPLILDVGLVEPASFLGQRANHITHNQSEHLVNEGFISVSFESDRPFVIQKFQNFLAHLPTTIFRAKGILWFQERQSPQIFQFSGQRYDWRADPRSRASGSQLVIIGRHLQGDQIKAQLTDCLLN